MTSYLADLAAAAAAMRWHLAVVLAVLAVALVADAHHRKARRWEP